MKRIIIAILIAVFELSTFGQAKSDYADSIKKWRADHQAELLTDDGWFTVAGLFWLKDGVNTVGAGSGYDVELTDNFKQGKFGEIAFSNGKATLNVAPGVVAASGGKSVSTIELGSDDNSKPTKVTVGSQTFYLIKREERFGIRLKDTKNPPCTFTAFATCPLPPQQNRLEIEIKAGEKRYSH